MLIRRPPPPPTEAEAEALRFYSAEFSRETGCRWGPHYAGARWGWMVYDLKHDCGVPLKQCPLAMEGKLTARQETTGKVLEDYSEEPLGIGPWHDRVAGGGE